MKKYPILFAALLLGLVCAGLSLAFNEHIGSDTATYYCRMVDEFAAGNYQAAFFHIVPPLSPFLAGLFSKIGLSGWMAMKLVSSLFFLASVYWCYRLARLRLNPQQAQWCALLFVLCSKLLRYGMGGQLEAAKTFLLLFIFERLIVWLDSKRWIDLIPISLATAALALARNEGLGYLPLVLGVLFVADWIPPAKTTGLARSLFNGTLRCMLVLGVCLAVWSPWIAYQYKITGYAVLSSKHIPIVGKLMPWMEVENCDYIQEQVKMGELARQQSSTLENPPLIDPPASRPSLIDSFRNPQPCTKPFMFIETVKGVYPRYFIFALIGFISLIRTRKWCRMDTLLAVFFTYHVVVYWLLSHNILMRLIIPGIPLYFPWMIIGAVAIAKALKIDWNNKPHKSCLLVLAVVLLVSLLPSGMSSVRKSLRGKDDLQIEIAEWVRKNRDALDTNPAPPLKSGIYVRAYHSGRQPVIMGFHTVPYRAQGDAMLQDSLPGLPHEQFVELCKAKGLDVIITDQGFKSHFSKVDLNDSRFQAVAHPWKEQGVIVYTFIPE